MAQLNMHVTPDFNQDLRQFMRRRGLKTKAEAIRLAVREALQHSRPGHAETDFGQWLGMADTAGLRPSSLSDDELWDGR